MHTSYSGLPVTVMGLGSFGGGVSAARFLAEQGAAVTITDMKSEAELADSIAALADVPIRRVFFGHHPPEAFDDCELLVVNPAVRPDDPSVVTAVRRGIDVTTEIELFLRHNPASVIAVTGSNGKSTTTALIHHLLIHAAAESRVWLGGNIGVSLLDRLPEITAEDLVVLELSSFQLEFLRARRFRPNIAVLTNFSPNHLDWHGTESAYRKAKQGIFDAQTADDVAIVPDVAESAAEWRTRGHRFLFGTEDTGCDGVFLEQETLVLRSSHGRFEDAVRIAVPGQLPGEHNRLNIAAAACAAWQAGADPHLFSEALRSFRPLPHRLQLVAEQGGRRFWNDSIATTPESAIMALKVFTDPIVLLAGGYDKGQDLREFAEVICSRASAVVLMGQTAGALEELIAAKAGTQGPAIRLAVNFSDAFGQAVALSRGGTIVLLSPGCASYGWFRDYRERGELFTKMAREWSPVS
jgi:UDP-N-acetylmuramoylalanine--D-glutamate ligase